MPKYLALLIALTAACTTAPKLPATLAEMPDIDTAAALTHIRALASDQFEGRSPGSKGEQLTVDYLVSQFKALGLEPGNPDGSYVQKVPLVGILPKDHQPLAVTKGPRKESFKPNDEAVVFSTRVTEAVEVKDSEIVFAGYGVQAPEFQWDDFAGLDVKGKTLVVLVNDPPVATAAGALDASVFGGRAMTYYGRWTYKYEKAAELGAAAVFIVHETEPAGYPFTVVQGFGRERFGLVTPDKNMSKPAIQGWLSRDAAARLLKLAGQDYETLKKASAARGFKPVPLGLRASMSFAQTLRTLDSQNVIARLPGSDPAVRDQHVVYTAHWDHFGIGPAVANDTIYNGAADNATGTAALLVIAKALKSLPVAPRRSSLFLAVTAEEQGLLGSEYYASFPLHPLAKTVANINADANFPMWGRTTDVIVIGLGASDLDDYLRDAASEQGRTLEADVEPEKGFYYRSDHFNFAKVGVPALNLDDGIRYRDKPAEFGKQKKDEYTARDYHQPSDDVKADWDLTGYAEQAKLLMAVGYRVAQAERMPEWKPGNEFKAIRDRMLGR